MQKSNVISFLVGVVLTTAVFFGFGIGGVGDGGQGFIFKRPTGGNEGGGIVLQNQNNYDGQSVGRVQPNGSPVDLPAAERGDNGGAGAVAVPNVPIQRGGLGNNAQVIAEPEREIAVADNANPQEAWNDLLDELRMLGMIGTQKYIVATQFCRAGNSRQDTERLYNSVRTIESSLTNVRTLATGANPLNSLRNANTLASLRTNISSISLSLLNIEELVNRVPNECLSPVWKHAAFPYVSSAVLEDLTEAGEWRDEMLAKVNLFVTGYTTSDLGGGGRLTGIWSDLSNGNSIAPLGQRINEAFAALEDAL